MKNDRESLPGNDFPARLGKPALRALANVGISKLEQISELSEAELKQLHGIGPNAVELLRNVLEMNGLKFADK